MPGRPRTITLAARLGAAMAAGAGYLGVFLTACDAPHPNEPYGAADRDGRLTQVAYAEPAAARAASEDGDRFTRNFDLSSCTFRSTGGPAYYPLVPGDVRFYEGVSDGVRQRLEQRVLHRTLIIDGIETRVLEERHFDNDELVEVSLNYFAHCVENGSVYYFGEDVDNYRDGRVVDHDGTWRHGVAGARAGLQMAGLVLLGSRYYQEIAPTAQDRAETLRLDAQLTTPAGHFRQVLVSAETTPLEPGARDVKKYAPGIGLIADNEVVLVSRRRQ